MSTITSPSVQPLKRFALGVAIGGASFACSIVAAVLMFEIVYGIYDYGDAFYARATIRHLLAWIGFSAIVGASLAALLGAPLLAVRRWRTNALLCLVVAGICAGIFLGTAADRALLKLTVVNCSVLDHAFPNDIDCGG